MKNHKHVGNQNTKVFGKYKYKLDFEKIIISNLFDVQHFPTYCKPMQS